MILQTSIQKLDDLTGGGLKSNKSVLLLGEPGVDEHSFAYQILLHRISKGDHCIYLVNNKIPRIVRKELRDFDLSVEDYEKRGCLSFFDCYSDFLGISSEEKFSSKFEMKDIKSKLFESLAYDKEKNKLLLIDSLSTFFDLCNQKEVFSCMKELLDKAEEFNFTPVFLFTDWPYSKKLKNQIRMFFDCVIELKAMEKTIFLRNYFKVSKANWIKNVNNQEIPFKVLSPGGIRVYIPKILVTGPYNAGKSSFVHSASTKAVSVERIGLGKNSTTVALDHGHVDLYGFAVDLFGTPGQERFDPLLKMLGGESLGVIVVVDSTNPKSFARAKEMLSKTKTEGLPSIIVANKANLKGALQPRQIKKKLGLDKGIQVIPVIAENLKAIREGLNKKKICKLKKEDTARVLNTLFKEII